MESRLVRRLGGRDNAPGMLVRSIFAQLIRIIIQAPELRTFKYNRNVLRYVHRLFYSDIFTSSYRQVFKRTILKPTLCIGEHNILEALKAFHFRTFVLDSFLQSSYIPSAEFGFQKKCRKKATR